MSEFVSVAIESEPSQLQDVMLDELQALLEAKGVLGYEPNEGNLEVILSGPLSAMTASAAVVAATAPLAIFREYGTQLFKLLFNEGASATATTTWKFFEEGGEFPARTIEAGTAIEAGGLAFTVEKETKTVKGEKEVKIAVVAVERGTEYNGVKGTAQLVNSLNFVEPEITIIGETSGGVNQETDEEYRNRLVAQLELQAPRPVTATNFSTFALTAPASILPTGVIIGRATAIDGYEKYTTPVKIEGKPTSAKTDLKEVSSLVGMSFESTTLPQKHPGSRLKWEAAEGVLPKGVTAKAKLGAAEVELSAAAEKTEAKGKIEILDQWEVQRCVTVFVTNKQGKTITSEGKTKLKEYLEKFRELNFKIFVEDPNYNEIQVKGQIHALPGFVAATVAENAKKAVESFLSPETWGNPIGGQTGVGTWLNATEGANLVRYNQIIGVMEQTSGVQYVPAGSAGLSIGLEEAPGSKTADLTMLGPAPLPETKAANVTITAV